MEYTILSSDNTDYLQEVVEQYISDGWLPLGGIAVVTYGHTVTCYYQSMTKVIEPVTMRGRSSGKK